MTFVFSRARTGRRHCDSESPTLAARSACHPDVGRQLAKDETVNVIEGWSAHRVQSRILPGNRRAGLLRSALLRTVRTLLRTGAGQIVWNRVRLEGRRVGKRGCTCVVCEW